MIAIKVCLSVILVGVLGLFTAMACDLWRDMYLPGRIMLASAYLAFLGAMGFFACYIFMVIQS